MMKHEVQGLELILDDEQEDSFLTLDVNNVNSSDHEMDGESLIS